MGNATSELGAFGGLFFLLSFAHFVVDWGLQTHKEAMEKSKDSWVRSRHCTVYMVGMAPLVYMINPATLYFTLPLLWFSHFLIDTYVPVYLWLKYVRRYPTFHEPEDEDVTPLFKGDSDLDKLRGLARTPLGIILLITMDQVCHLLFLVPVAALGVWPQDFHIWAIASGLMTMLFLVMVVSGARGLIPKDSRCPPP